MKTVAVIFGSRSAEHDVSIITALSAVIKPLELSGKYKVVPVYIDKQGSWYSDEVLKNVEFFTNDDFEQKLKSLKKINLSFDGGFWLVKAGLRGKRTKIDVVFPATHGTFGEDGSLMGLLEMADVPYVGCDLPSSVIAMDKVLSKQVTSQEGIPTNKWLAFTSEQYNLDNKKMLADIGKLEFPLFVKPAHLGSSIAISRVEDKKALELALELAFHYDDKVIVEEEVKNLIEVTVPIIGNDVLQVAMVEQPLRQGAEFFDFETKYMHGGKKGKNGKGGGADEHYSRIPADISKKLYKASEDMAMAVYRAVECCGIARVDLLIDGKSQKIYFNEVNPLPGSLYKHNWQKAGVSAVELVDRLVGLAFERYQSRSKMKVVFKTNFLKQFKK